MNSSQKDSFQQDYSVQDYSKKTERLEEILAKMERTALPLEETLELYDEAQKILKDCREFLTKAESRVKKLESDGSLSDFGEAAGESKNESEKN